MKAATRLVSSFLAAFAAIVAMSGSAEAQAVASIPTGDAQAFVGDWSLPITGDQPAEFLISLSDNAGNLGGTVTIVGMSEPAAVTSVSKAGDDLILAYGLDMGGQSIPVSIKLTPATATTLNASLDFAEGMFTATGTATKK